MRTSRRWMFGFAAAGLLASTACGSDEPTAPVEDEDPDAVHLVSLQPAVGAVGVSLDAQIEVRFDGPVSSGVLALMALQMGECPAPVVGGTWTLSDDGLLARFQPVMPLMPNQMYSVHVGGRLMDSLGRMVDIEAFGPGMGGTWVTLEMAGGMNGMGMGMGSGVNHTGPGWQHPGGMYGLAFSFTTGD